MSCHNLVTYSSACISHSLGMVSISLKNMSDDKNRKAVKNGLNIMLPIGDRMESGSPHATIMGNETSVRNNWIMVKSNSQWWMRYVSLFMVNEYKAIVLFCLQKY